MPRVTFLLSLTDINSRKVRCVPFIATKSKQNKKGLALNHPSDKDSEYIQNTPICCIKIVISFVVCLVCLFIPCFSYYWCLSRMAGPFWFLYANRKITFSFLFCFQYSGLHPREYWDMWHPTLVAEALFAIANIFSSLRLISLFTANSHLGPLQISLGRMLLDILKFLFIYCLVLLAFANGLNQLYFYYETKENQSCKGIRCEKQNNAFST